MAEAVADSALCLLVGTRLSVTARTGLDDALAVGADRVHRLGARRTLPCTHVHTDDLRGSLTLLTHGADRRTAGPPACGSPTRCRTAN